MKKFLAVLLVVILLTSTVAFAYGPIYSSNGTGKSKPVGKAVSYMTQYKKVRAVGKCNIRPTASLQEKSLGTFYKGRWMTYLGKMQKDTRGVKWFKVITSKGVIGWVSEGYTKLEK